MAKSFPEHCCIIFVSLEYSNFPPALALHALRYTISGQSPRQYEVKSECLSRRGLFFLRFLEILSVS